MVLSSNFGALREQGLDVETTACRNRLFAYKCINVFLYLVPTIDVDPGNALEKKTNGAAIADCLDRSGSLGRSNYNYGRGSCGMGR